MTGQTIPNAKTVFANRKNAKRGSYHLRCAARARNSGDKWGQHYWLAAYVGLAK